MGALSQNVLVIQFVVLLALVIVDVVSAIAVALRTNEFHWENLLDFLKTNVAPYVLIWAALGGVGLGASKLEVYDETLASLAVMVNIPYAAVVAKLFNSIYDHMKDLGLNLPLKKGDDPVEEEETPPE